MKNNSPQSYEMDWAKWTGMIKFEYVRLSMEDEGGWIIIQRAGILTPVFYLLFLQSVPGLYRLRKLVMSFREMKGTRSMKHSRLLV
jgi:hypothetical protein